MHLDEDIVPEEIKISQREALDRYGFVSPLCKCPRCRASKRRIIKLLSLSAVFALPITVTAYQSSAPYWMVLSGNILFLTWLLLTYVFLVSESDCLALDAAIIRRIREVMKQASGNDPRKIFNVDAASQALASVGWSQEQIDAFFDEKVEGPTIINTPVTPPTLRLKPHALEASEEGLTFVPDEASQLQSLHLLVPDINAHRGETLPYPDAIVIGGRSLDATIIPSMPECMGESVCLRFDFTDGFILRGGEKVTFEMSDESPFIPGKDYKAAVILAVKR